MLRRLADFLDAWEPAARHAAACFDALTDAALDQPVAAGHRTLGRVAWHLVQSVPEMMGRTGLPVAGPGPDEAVPERAAAIAEAWRGTAAAFDAALRRAWDDATLEQEDDLYGNRWKRGFTLQALLLHHAHHVGQLGVLMRQAGLRVPGVYGPAREEWAAWGQEPPPI